MATDDTLRKRKFRLGRIADSLTAPVSHKDPVNQETQENGDNKNRRLPQITQRREFRHRSLQKSP
jgi:hypothetical protein